MSDLVSESVCLIGAELAVAIHDRQLSEHTGTSGIRDRKLLDSALARPRQTLAYADPPADLAACAASLMLGIARNHPFVDGNKRTAMVCTELFIELNGGELLASDADLYPVVLEVAEGHRDEQQLAAWLRPLIRQDADGVHEPIADYGT